MRNGVVGAYIDSGMARSEFARVNIGVVNAEPPVRGGLNAGQEFDEEIPLIPVEVDSEIAEVLTEVEALVALETRLDDLNYLFADISRSHGMCKNFALEAERIIPGFGGVPLTYYTEAPTATRYKVALEEISRNMWALIAAGAVAVIALIAKLISWFSGGKKDKVNDGTSSAEKKIETVKDNIQDTMKDLKKTGEIVNDAANVIVRLDLPDGRRSLDQRVDDLVNNKEERTAHALELLNSTNPIFHDIINHGAYSKAMIAIGSQLQLIDAKFSERLDQIEEIIRSDMADGSTNQEAINNKMKLAAHAKPLVIKYDNREMTIVELSKYLDAIKEKVESQTVSKKIPLTRLHQSFEHSLASSQVVAMLSNVQVITGKLDKFEALLSKLESVARDISTDGLSGAVTEGVGPMIRSTLHAIGQDISGFGRLSWQILSYVKTMQYLSRGAIGLAKEMIRRISGEVKKEGGTFPKEWDEIVNELKSRSEAIIGRSHFG